MKYWPNPAHKRGTSEAGPPLWRPHKSVCPKMTIDERSRLLDESIPEDANDVQSTRYALRRVATGMEWFAARFTQMDADEAVFHGYPADFVPAKVLRRFRDDGRISETEYRRLIRDLG